MSFFVGKVVEVRQLLGVEQNDPLHGERLALAQRVCAVMGMMVFLLVSFSSMLTRLASAIGVRTDISNWIHFLLHVLLRL